MEHFYGLTHECFNKIPFCLGHCILDALLQQFSHNLNSTVIITRVNKQNNQYTSKWYCVGTQERKLFLAFYNNLFKNKLHKNIIEKLVKVAEFITLITGLKFTLIYSSKKLQNLLLTILGLSHLQRKKVTGTKLPTNQMGMLPISTNQLLLNMFIDLHIF